MATAATDVAAWADETAALLRQGAELDEERRQEIVEELEWMALSSRRERDRRMIAVIMHLLQIEYEPDNRLRAWYVGLSVNRNELKTLRDESPSLFRNLELGVPKLYARAKDLAEIGSGLNIFPAQNPFTIDQLLNG